MARRRGVSGFSPIAGRWALIALAVVVGTSSLEAQDRSEADRSWKASWEARQAREVERRRVEQMRRAYEFRRAIAHARMRSEPDISSASSASALRASTPPVAEAMCSVLSDPATHRQYQHQAHKWREQAFRRSTGLQPRTGLSVFSASKPSNPAFAKSVSPTMVSTAVLASVAASASASSVSESAYMVPLFPSASDARGRQGFARVINHSGEAGEVTIEAFDDEGMSYGPLTLSIGAGETVHFNSNDLEDGNAGKGLTEGTGPGQGDWRLELTSGLDIEVLSYIRTTDGFLTAMHDTVPVVDGRREAAIFNPGSNADQESLLRLVNPGGAEAVVTITGVDDKGMSPGEGATVTIPAGASRTYTAAELESGSASGLEGSIGDGSGKWRLVIESEHDIVSMSLLSSPTGHLTNLSTAPGNEQDGTHAVPLFPSASDARGRQGFARVANRSDEAGEVMIEAFDDTDREYEVLTLSIGANETRHFNSNDLELGNADKGLTGSTGAGDGDWRLELSSELDIEVLSYIRTTDGFLTAMHDLVPRSAKRHRVAVFNPGSNLNQQSVLRLVNPGEEPAEVTIAGFDDRDASPGSDVIVTVPAGGSASHTAAELESGGEEFEGALGNGTGKWRLTVNADRPIVAMSLLSSPTGHLTNLSTAPERGAGPVETAPEAYEALISPIVQGRCVNCHVEGGASGHTPLVFVRATDADHLAKNLSVFENYLAEVEGGADRILNKIQGALAHGGGVQVASGTEEYGSFETYMELLGADVDRSNPVDLFEGVTLESPRRTLWRAAIVFAGRIPTAAEYAEVEGGTEDDLRRAIRGLMQGPGFHEFLIRAANDRLLTDRHIGNVLGTEEGFLVEFHNEYVRLCEAAYASGDESAWHAWETDVQYGGARAPLELIAYVVENERPYTEILTGNYIMANPLAAKAYGSEVKFADPDDVHEFKPAQIESYYREDDTRVYGDEVNAVCGRYIVDPGKLETEYPHAGILNTKVFLQRYPTTATNRNRARSRWTYYHFLGFDVEKSESRTMDPDVLKDTNNPTLHNPACTACHERLDPVAGAFQNYGDVGYYRDQFGGMDSLDLFYKNQLAGGEDVVVDRLSWEERQEVSVRGKLLAGPNNIGLQVILPPNDDHSGWTPHVGIDHVTVRSTDGSIVDRYQLEEVFAERSDWPEKGEYCGHTMSSDGGGTRDSYRLWECPLVIPVDVPHGGDYIIEVSTWILDDEGRDPAATATLRVWVPAYSYELGDTWYRGMRDPGFGGELVPTDYTDNSLQWLAQRIVEDELFAEAAVKFWWPAIVGGEVVSPPEEDEADFEGMLLASNTQLAEVNRLANGFRRGFADGSPFKLKDLLVEIMLSKWFRADSFADDDPIRSTALAGAGAKRLLTPEELARKTLALTGFSWGRGYAPWRNPSDRYASSLTDEGYGYRLLYGGIDSAGVTDRARDITAVMAAVAQSHAMESSCPIVRREIYLLPDEERRLFGGIDKNVSPVSEFHDAFEISASSRSEMEEMGGATVEGRLSAGEISVALAFMNDFADDEGNDRDLLLDRLVVRRGDEVVLEYEMENHEHDYDCHHIEQDAFHLSGSGPSCVLTVPLEITAGGDYAIDVWAWADQAGDDLAEMEVLVESDAESSAGAHAIRSKLAELFGTLMGIRVADDAPEVEAAYGLFVDVWNRKRESAGTGFDEWEENIACPWENDFFYLNGILDDYIVEDENGHPTWDQERVDALHSEIDWSDRRAMARTWIVVLSYLLMDSRYLYL